MRLRIVFATALTLLRNHAPHIAAMDLFKVPTIGFIQLYVLAICRLARRELVWANATHYGIQPLIAAIRAKCPEKRRPSFAKTTFVPLPERFLHCQAQNGHRPASHVPPAWLSLARCKRRRRAVL
jgi:hypothetical protein